MAQNNVIGNDLNHKCVLITRFTALGDVVMTIPVIYSACRCYPEVKFVLLTRRSLEDLFVGRPDNLIVETVDLKNEYTGLRGRYHLVARLQDKYTFDGYIDLQHDSVTAPISAYFRLHGVKTAVFDKELKHKRALTRNSDKVMLPLISTRARYREAFFHVHLPIDDKFEGIYGAGGKGTCSLFADITAAKAPGEKWIGIAPFAAYPPKEYPLDRMEEVIASLAAEPDTKIFIFGGDGREAEQADKWASAYHNVVTLAGQRHGFPAELSLMSHLDLIITMDSANMHLASIVGVPTLSIWGATHHYCGFKGWRQSEKNMVQLPLSCRPCSITGEKPCCRHDTLCLTAIRPDIIIKKAKEILTSA